MDAAPKPVPPPAPAAWRRDAPPEPAAASRAGPRRVFVALVLLFAIGGTIAAILTWAAPRPAAAVVTLLAAPPAPDGPPLIGKDQSALLHSGMLVRNSPDPSAAPTRGTLEARLREIEKLSRGRAAVVSVAGRAECDAAGRVVLIPADAAPGRPQDGLPLRSVLESLRAAPARNKLLVLDLSWPSAGPAVSLVSGLVAGRIPDELDAVNDPDRLTLCSCGPGQVALASEDLGRTVFGFYFEEGLRGWAAPPGAAAVTARDLARFVQARVRRWAEQNRGTRQTPTLYGDAADFPLVALRGGRPGNHLEPAPAADYPAWLRDQWAVRDRLRAQDAERFDPRGFRKLEGVLLAAESAWRGGADTAIVRRQLQDDVARLADLIGRHLAAPGDTRPPNLASRAGPPDPALADAVREYLRAVGAAKPEDAAKLTADTLAKLRAKPAADSARAVFEAAADERSPTPDAVRRLDDLMRSLDPRPRFVETIFLSRLADAARTTSPGEWPTAAVARALAVVRAGERAARPTAFPAVARLLEEAAHERHDGETRLLPFGYAPPAEAERHLARAEELYRQVVRVQDACEAADAELARALPFLAAFAGTLSPAAAERWYAAAADARALADARRTLAAPGDDLLRNAAAVEELTRRLAVRVAPLAEPFHPNKVKDAVAAARRPDPTPDVFRDLDALLATPHLTADLRVQVWQAARDVGGRLAAATREVDAADGQPPPTADPVPSFRAEWEGDEQAERDRRANELRTLVALVRMAGLPVTAALAPFENLSGELDAEPARRAELADQVRNAWVGISIPPQLDRLVRVLPPRDPAPGLDDEPPAAKVRAQEAAALGTWLAGWYELDAADPTADGLFATAALDYRLAAKSRAEPPPRVALEPAAVALTESVRSAAAVLRIELPTPPDVSVVAADTHWLDVRLGTPQPSEDGKAAVEMPVRVSLKPGAEASAAAPPRGFLIRIRSGERNTYLRVPVNLSAVRERLELLFSTDPSLPTAPTLTPTIRPGGSRQPYYLYLRNPGDRPRAVSVELAAGDRLLQAAVRVPPGTTAPVRFAPPPPKPEAAPAPAPKPADQLPDELPGPLVFRVFDTERANAVVLRTEVRPEVSRPSAYVRVAAARIHAPGPATGNKNRVEVVLRPVGSLPPPAAKAELVVLPAVPGPPPAGTLRGDVPADGELRLFADGVTPAPDGGVRFYVNIDGVERVFRFHSFVPTAGDPISPRPLAETTLTLIAPPAAPSGPHYPVKVAVDNPPPGATLGVGLGRLTPGGLEADASKTFATPRHHRIGWALTTDGGLAFDAAIRDWVAEFDVAQIRGRRVVRAQLLDAAGAEIRSVADEVVLDDQPAEKVGFLDLPKQAKLGTTITLKALGKADVAGVKEVHFFVGKPAEGKLPPGVTLVAGKPTDPDQRTWTAELTLPKDKAGPIDLGARFVTGTGVTAFAAGSIELVDFDPAKVAPGKITGVLMEGEVPQVGLEVALRDDKGAERAKATTAAGGSFSFDPVPPGTYKLVAVKRVSGAEKEATAEVKLAPGGAERRRLDLYLTGK